MIIIIVNIYWIESVATTSESRKFLPDLKELCTDSGTVAYDDSAPADYGNLEGKFESCLSDNQRYPGVYVNGAGQTVT